MLKVPLIFKVYKFHQNLTCVTAQLVNTSDSLKYLAIRPLLVSCLKSQPSTKVMLFRKIHNLYRKYLAPLLSTLWLEYTLAKLIIYNEKKYNIWIYYLVNMIVHDVTQPDNEL